MEKNNVKHINGYTIIRNNSKKLFEITCGDDCVIQTEPTMELAALWTYHSLYEAMKWNSG